jgi:dimethylhistidine N-methyltransferase
MRYLNGDRPHVVYRAGEAGMVRLRFPVSHLFRDRSEMGQRRVHFFYHDLKPDPGSFLEDVLAGLSRRQKALNPKYFYDEQGSALFEAICDLPEYYPTRTEMEVMRTHRREIARCLGPGSVLIEYGSGSGRKTRLLIEEIQPAAYVAIDISATQLKAAAEGLAAAFPGVTVAAVCADYTRGFTLPQLAGRRRVIYFPGSTIGNFTVAEATGFLRLACAQAGPGGAMLVGVDLKKDAGVLNAAYNDALGVTAQFNLNLLARINRELGGDFDLAAFRHHAFYDPALGRIEMHLVSLREQKVAIAGRVFELREGETIHTENSYKYSVDEFRNLAREAGFSPERYWVDPDDLFSVHYLVVP